MEVAWITQIVQILTFEEFQLLSGQDLNLIPQCYVLLFRLGKTSRELHIKNYVSLRRSILNASQHVP